MIHRVTKREYAGIVIILIVIIITVQRFLPGKPDYFNNYLIFKNSFLHLAEYKDLYKLYPSEYFDYYKYSPTFALLMAPFACLPNMPGLLVWNLLNALVLFFAIWKLPGLTDRWRMIILGLSLPALITSLQNSQSNCLMAGLIIFSFISMEKRKPGLASLLIVITIFIKIFGIVGLTMFVFYPDKRKAIIYTALWTILIAILPLVFVSLHQLGSLYTGWISLMKYDEQTSFGISVAGIVHDIFHVRAMRTVLFSGILLFILPLLNYKSFSELRFRMCFLASVLIWSVIFNHKAESPTFIIAMTGIGIWFCLQKTNFLNICLLILAFVFTSLAPTDLFPAGIRIKLLDPFDLMALPCLLIWIRITIDLLRPKAYFSSAL